MTLAALQKALTATDKFLSNVRHLSNAAALEEKQQAQLLKIMETVSFTVEDAAVVSSQVSSTCLSQSTKDTLMSCLTSKADGDDFHLPSESKSRRANMQDWTSLVYYLCESHWSLLLGDCHHGRRERALASLARHLSNMGLWAPSEKTIAVVVALVYWGDWSKTLSDGQALVLQEQGHALKASKPLFKKYLHSGGGKPPKTLLEDLPSDPMEFSDYKRVFAKEEPIKPPIDTDLFFSTVASMRGRMASSTSSTPTASYGSGNGVQASQWQW